jgi:hypothetical protein
MDKSPGYQSLKQAVTKDCEEQNGIFHPDGCIEKCPGSNCYHSFCDKFAWVMNRALHYSGFLNIPVEEILDRWEQDRNYWYMNYYQDCSQPLLTGQRIRVFDTVEDFKASGIDKGFRCPACDGISTHPTVCNSGLQINGRTCDWKAYGLFGTLGKGTYVFVKSRVEGHTIFTPVAWEV